MVVRCSYCMKFFYPDSTTSINIFLVICGALNSLLFLFVTKEERFSHAVKSLEFDRHLGAYDLTRYGEWKSLSNYLTKDVIERIGMFANLTDFHFQILVFVQTGGLS